MSLVGECVGSLQDAVVTELPKLQASQASRLNLGTRESNDPENLSLSGYFYLLAHGV